MFIKKEPLYSLKDVAIIPAVISEVDHRIECNPFYKDGKLPIFTSPMPCVVDINTYGRFESHGIHAILPRTVDIKTRIAMCVRQWCAFSLTEFEENFVSNRCGHSEIYALVDIANGNMEKLYNLSKDAKEYYGDTLKLMVGNIANPETFRKFCKIGVDYVRCSVGSGNACNTATFLGILYPMASLIDDCRTIKEDGGFKTKIVADGGLSSFRRMFKALALGADYIMLGSALNKLSDSAGEVIPKMVIDEETGHLVQGYVKEYYGMASEKGMKMLGKTGEPEGKVIYNKCEGTIESFTKQFANYLKSLMSYCSIKELDKFIGKPEVRILSTNASNQFNKS